MDLEIILNPSEFFQAAMIGIMRQVQNVKNGRIDAYGAENSDGWGLHIEGACGEAAVAKLLNIYYTGNIGNLSACDVNNAKRNIEVRTRSKHWYDLITHEKDKDESIFILLTGKAPVFVFRGWIYGKDAKHPKFWKDPGTGRPAYFTPQSELKGLNELREIITI